MSLVKKPEMTEKKVAANRQNQELCNGPVTDERRERICAALRRFGFDAQKEEIAMRALGEEPADFQELLEGLWGEYNPAGASQEGVVISLGRAMLADESRRPHAGGLRRAAGPGGDHRPGGPAARSDDATEDDGGDFAPARPVGRAQALHHHSRGPGGDEAVAR